MHNQPFQWSIWLRSKTGLVTLAFLAIATFYLATEHTAHFLGVLPFAIFLLCPLLMLFMHGGHGGQGDDHTQHAVQPTGERPKSTDQSTQQAEDHAHQLKEAR